MRSTAGLSGLLIYVLLCTHWANASALDRRQADASSTSITDSATSVSSTVSQNSDFPVLPTTTVTPSTSESSDPSASVSQSGVSAPVTLNSTSTSSSSSLSVSSTTSNTYTPTATAVHNGTNGTATSHLDQLPLTPKITPALSIAGVILMLSGSACVLIGVKNRSIQIFLSTAYLTSLSITVLIVYVMSPPITNAVQGAYFVAAFMTGVLFGAGSLMFPEVTEGFGCFLGGICLSMWFLVLKPGGTLTGTVGKIVFVLVFGTAVWLLSFTKRTRPYGLIGGTSFSGATAVVLGMDCFCRAGLKEFWLYIWALNNNLFPLNTTTYPITRGMQVEIAAIVLICIVGVISQLKLWRVIKDRREKKESEQRDVERRKSAMEEAMGRYLEARTDREKAQWERIYGPQWNHVYNDHVNGSRSTIADPLIALENDKRKSWIDVREVSIGDAAAMDLERNRSNLPRADQKLLHRLKRQSSATVHTIPEDDETDTDISPSATAVRSASSSEDGPDSQSASSPKNSGATPAIQPLPFIIPNSAGADHASANASVPERKHTDSNLLHPDKQASGKSILKKRSGQSEIEMLLSSSEDTRIVPGTSRSRASSNAATLNDELGDLDLQSVYSEAPHFSNGPYQELMPAEMTSAIHPSSSRLSYLGDRPPSPAALSVDSDPEEFARPGPAIPEPSVKATTGTNMFVGKANNFYASSNRDAAEKINPTFNEAKEGTTSLVDIPPADTLTTGALVQIPSQLSDVVMTYRTNEWAKHISNAEFPIDDRANSILGDDFTESPVHLVKKPAPVLMEELGQTVIIPGSAASPSTSSKSPQVLGRSDKRRSAAQRPSEPSMGVTGAPLEGIDDPNLHKSYSDQSIATSPAINICPPTSAGGQSAPLRPQMNRGSSASRLSQILPPTIDENMETPFTSISPPISPPPPSLNHSTSLLSTARPEKPPRGPVRSSSNMSLPLRGLSPQIYQQAVATTSDTRLSSSKDSRQPQRRASSFVPGKRDSLLVDWQGSMRRESSMVAAPQLNLDQRRADMMLERRQSQQSRELQEVNQQYRDKFVEQAMRTTDMQALHREAMRKMQAKANKHV